MYIKIDKHFIEEHNLIMIRNIDGVIRGMHEIFLKLEIDKI